jgi:hypothetical protein
VLSQEGVYKELSELEDFCLMERAVQDENEDTCTHSKNQAGQPHWQTGDEDTCTHSKNQAHHPHWQTGDEDTCTHSKNQAGQPHWQTGDEWDCCRQQMKLENFSLLQRALLEDDLREDINQCLAVPQSDQDGDEPGDSCLLEIRRLDDNLPQCEQQPAMKRCSFCTTHSGRADMLVPGGVDEEREALPDLEDFDLEERMMEECQDVNLSVKPRRQTPSDGRGTSQYGRRLHGQPYTPQIPLSQHIQHVSTVSSPPQARHPGCQGRDQCMRCTPRPVVSPPLSLFGLSGRDLAAEFYSFDDDNYDETARSMMWTGMGEEDGSLAEDLALDLDDRETALSMLRRTSPVGQQARTGRNRCQQAPHGNPRTRTQTDQYQNIDNSDNVVSYNTDNEYGIEYDDSNVCIDSSYLDSTGVSAKASAIKERYSQDKTFTASVDEQDRTIYASKSLCSMSPYTKHFHMMSNAPAAFARPMLLPCSATSSLFIISPNIKPWHNCLEKAPGSYTDHNASPSAGRPQAGMCTRDRFSFREELVSTETHQEASCVSLTCRNPRRVIQAKTSGARLSCAKTPQPDRTQSDKEKNAKCPAQQSANNQQARAS